MKKVKIADDWYALLESEFQQPYFDELTEFVRNEYATTQICPPEANIFRAFDLCPLDKLRVVIIGQDPYHGDGQADGLCFSVQPGVPLPPSLKNIFKEVANCGYTTPPANGDLERWASQGVLLLNSVLTVRAHQAGSHSGHGWERFTNAVIEQINRHKTGVVYMLWGAYAQRKAAIVDKEKNEVFTAYHPSSRSAGRGYLKCGHFADANHKAAIVDKEKNLVLTAVHPSPLSAYRGYLGCGHFAAANRYLSTPIEW